MTELKSKAFEIVYGLYNMDAIGSSDYAAIRDGLEEIETLRDRDECLEELWSRFADVPMDPNTECIEEGFMGWGPGVSREEIWHWFDRRHSKGVAYLLYGTAIDRQDQLAKLLYMKQLCIECESVTCQYNHGGECRFALVHERKARITDGLVGASLVKYYVNDDHGHWANDPLHTITSKYREGVMAANLTKFYGGVVGASVTEPTPTITSIDHNAVTVAHMMEMYGTSVGRGVNDPAGTVTASGAHHAIIATSVVPAGDGINLGHWPEVRGLLNKYCGYDLKDDELLLLQINGIWWFIRDIGLRMLTPMELYAANGFPPDYIIDHDYQGNVYGKTKQVARCGNAVPPPFAAALVRANLPEWCEKRYSTMAEFETAVAV